MIGATVAEVAAAVGGRLDDASISDVQIRDVTSDSRTIRRGDLFVALAGTKVDGHSFAKQAIDAGAIAVLAAHSVGVPAIVVDDVLVSLGRLARFHLDQLPELTVVAITGSAGKTTTKDLTAELLEGVGPTVAPPGSFNNELGLPMTVLTADVNTRYLVLEMGARGKRHIEYLCDIAPPTVGVELMVGTAHMGEFGSREAITAAKAELVQALDPSGVAILNADDERVLGMRSSTEARVVTFGTSETADIRASHVVTDGLDRPSFVLHTPDGTTSVDLQMSGSHLVTNALAAAAVGWVLDMPLGVIAERLARATPRSRWRMEITERPDGVTIVNDAYNASPESMRAALKSLKRMAQGRRAWAVLGEMLELGPESVAEHDAVGRLVVRLDVDRLIAVGPGARPLHLAAHLEGSWGDESVFVPDADAALAVLREQLEPGDVVLIKASRSIGLERVAAELARGTTQTGAGDSP